MKKELQKIQTFMQHLSEGKTLPKNLCSELKGRHKSDSIKDYEFRTKHLRVYFFIDISNGRVIVNGGMKTTQKKDIKRLRETKKIYFNK